MFLLLNGNMLTYVFLHFLDETSQKYHRSPVKLPSFQFNDSILPGPFGAPKWRLKDENFTILKIS